MIQFSKKVKYKKLKNP